jgi:uncharacterized protein (TIGR00255 family)
MIVSMTGFGKAEGSSKNINYTLEARSVNSRFLEIFFRMPKKYLTKELELKEIIRKKISRGKINISFFSDIESFENNKFELDDNVIMEYYHVLENMRNKIGSEETIKIDHVLKFAEMFPLEDSQNITEDEMKFIYDLLEKSLDDLINMKKKEGKSLEKDMLQRIKLIDKESSEIQKISDKRVKEERKRLHEKIEVYLNDKSIINDNRLEMEIVLLVERIDITEEIIRLKSHTKYFIEYSKSEDHAGRRLNFLTQEINREINTIASKSSDAVISQKVAFMKEELEKIREQLQNVE